EKMRRVAGNLPFQHVIVDLSAEHGPANVLVVANETVVGEPLLNRIRERAKESPASFLIIAPQSEDESSHDAAERRLLQTVTRLRSEGLEVHGQITHPDPYTAAMQTVADERVDEIIVSTFPSARSGWLRRDLVGRLRNDAKVPVEHIEVDVPEQVTA